LQYIALHYTIDWRVCHVCITSAEVLKSRLHGIYSQYEFITCSPLALSAKSIPY